MENKKIKVEINLADAIDVVHLISSALWIIKSTVESVTRVSLIENTSSSVRLEVSSTSAHNLLMSKNSSYFKLY